MGIEQNHSSQAKSLSASQETVSPLMCSHWTLLVGGEFSQHPFIIFLVDPVVGEGGDNLKQEPLLHTKMAFTYFTVPKMVGGKSGCAYFGTYFLYKFV